MDNASDSPMCNSMWKNLLRIQCSEISHLLWGTPCFLLSDKTVVQIIGFLILSWLPGSSELHWGLELNWCSVTTIFTHLIGTHIFLSLWYKFTCLLQISFLFEYENPMKSFLLRQDCKYMHYISTVLLRYSVGRFHTY